MEDFPLIRGKGSVIMVRLATGLGIGPVTQGFEPLHMAKACRDPECRALARRDIPDISFESDYSREYLRAFVGMPPPARIPGRGGGQLPRGRPRSRSATMLRWTSAVPPQIVLPRLRSRARVQSSGS